MQPTKHMADRNALEPQTLTSLVEESDAQLTSVIRRTGTYAGLSSAIHRLLEATRDPRGSLHAMLALPFLACVAAGGSARDAIGGAAAWRALHIATVVWDDVADGDAHRVAGSAGVARFTNIGVCAYAGSTLCLSDLPPHRYSETAPLVHRAFCRIFGAQYCEHTVGEGDNVEECLRTVGEKAGTFYALGAQLGLAYGEPTWAGVPLVTAAAYNGGMIVQLRDDLQGLRERGAAGDLANRRRKLPVAYALSVTSSGERRELERLLEAAGSDAAAEEEARTALRALGAETYMRMEIERYRSRVRDTLAEVEGDQIVLSHLGDLLSDGGIQGGRVRK